jgi:RNA ligase
MSLHYEFPVIDHIEDVLPHIKDDKSFIVAKRDYGFVINYVMQDSNTFPKVDNLSAAIRRECRGLIFNLEGDLIRRPFHKFFNFGEREDIMGFNPFDRPHTVLEKLDGSMVTFLPLYDGSFRLATKMGITDVSMQAEIFVSDKPVYNDLAKYFVNLHMTPIFEWVSRKQRIVIDYQEDNLILTAIRHIKTGNYVNYNNLEIYGKMFHIPVVKQEIPTSDFVNYLDNLRKREDIEGMVIRFDDGHMVKIKTELYVSLHRAKSLLENERNVVGLILDDKTDDLISLLPIEDQKKLLAFKDNVWYDIFTFTTTVNNYLREYKDVARKDFAMSSINLEKVIRSFCFSNWDDRNCTVDSVVAYVARKLSSRSSFEDARNILKTAKWN